MPQDGVRVPVPNFGDYFSGRIGGVIHNILHTCGTREQFLQHLTTYCFAIRPACRSSQLPFAPMSGRPSQCLQMTFPPSASKILTQQPPNKTASRYDCLTMPSTATRARLNKGLAHITDFHHIHDAVVAWIPEGMRQQQKRLKSQASHTCWKGAFFHDGFDGVPFARSPVKLHHRFRFVFGQATNPDVLLATDSVSIKCQRTRGRGAWTITLRIGGARLGTSSYFKRRQRSGHELEYHRLHRLQTRSPWQIMAPHGN